MDLYSPIDGQLGEIRVLRIFPGSADDPIQCSLQLCSLVTEVKPYYRALSYAWGTEMSDIPISVDGHPRVITSNLYAALRSLRDEESEVALWVDALCINQQDLVEKMHQIGQMRTIYREAGQVVAWLGDHRQETEIEWLTSALDSFNSHILWDLHSPLKSIFDRAWWQRIWVLQEAVSASQQPMIRCGTVEAPWSKWERLARSLGFLRKYNVGFFEHVASLREGKRLGYSAVCALLHQMEATDPRDKIFALLGYFDCGLSDAMHADYSLPPANVYCRFTMREICDKGNLDALRVCPLGPEDRFSSWALGPRGVDLSIFCRHSPAWPRCPTTEGKTPQVRWSEDCTTMFAKGAVIGSINESLGPFDRGSYRQIFASLLLSSISSKKLFADMSIGRLLADDTARESERTFYQFKQHIVKHFFGDMDEEKHYFFKTSAEKFVLGDYGILSGDKICLLFGGSEAFVLRNHGRYYTLVGCAYIDGMEHGHLEKCLHDESNIVEFEIR